MELEKRGATRPCVDMARLKYKINDMQRLAEERGGKCLSRGEVRTSQNLEWQCAKGHVWKATPTNVMRGTWCGRCWGKYATIEDMREIARSRGGECLSKKYVDSQTKLKWRCSEGHVWAAQPNNVKAGQWCKKCKVYISEEVCRVAFEGIFGRKFPRSYPSWLKGETGTQLELDGYCPSLKLAFEHHGAHHYSHKNLFSGSKVKLRKRQAIDIYKIER